jgi:hypothetical protein
MAGRIPSTWFHRLLLLLGAGQILTAVAAQGPTGYQEYKFRLEGKEFQQDNHLPCAADGESADAWSH